MSLNIPSSPEHEFEPELGLPEKLPAGERILWQGSPDVKAMLLRVFHFKGLLIYFGLILLYQIVTGVTDSELGVIGEIKKLIGTPESPLIFSGKYHIIGSLILIGKIIFKSSYLFPCTS